MSSEVVLDPLGGAWFPGISTLAVSDLHLGYEATLRRAGAALPRQEVEVLLPVLDALVARHRPGVLVVNGDVKHAFGRILMDEAESVRAVWRFLAERVPRVVLVEGNHDADLARALPDAELAPSVTLGDWTFAHGHAAVDAPRHLCVGHEHPALDLADEVGAGVRLRAFLRDADTDGRETLVLPALSPWAAGYDVLRATPFLGAALAGRDRDAFRVAGLAGDEVLDFGPVGRLRAAMRAGATARSRGARRRRARRA